LVGSEFNVFLPTSLAAPRAAETREAWKVGVVFA